MTYTSFAGGWQIKQSDGLLPAEQDELVRRVPTRLSVIRSLPRFPSADDLDALPRRLTYSRRQGEAIFLHAAQAGDDGAGRPGNVFSHVVVVRPQRVHDGVRPIELWRSPRWLTPYGQPAVRAAEYDPKQPPAPHPGTSRAAAVDFVLDPRDYRFSGMSLLLDAVAETLSGGRALVLVSGSVAEGASWIGLVCWLAAAAGVTDLSFSTYERGSDVLVQVEHRLSVVVRGDLDVHAAATAGLLVVDPSWECELRTEADRDILRTPAGQDVVVTEWSGLALDVLAQGRDEALRTLELADAVAAAAVEQAGACAWWPLAVGVAMSPDLSMAWPLAARVVVSRTLDRPLPDHLRKACTEVVQVSSGSTADEAWSLLQHSGGNEAVLSIVFPAYVERVLDDRALLLAERRRALPLVPLPKHVRMALVGMCAPVLAAAVRELQARPQGVPDPHGDLYVLRLLDFVVRAGVPVGEFDNAATVLAKAIAEMLVDDAGAALMQRCGALSTETWRLVAPALDARLAAVPRPPGQRLATELLRQLETSVCALTRVGVLSLEEARSRDLDQEVAVAACRAGRWPDGASRAVPVAALLWSPAFAPEARAEPRERTDAVLQELRVENRLTLDELDVLAAHFAQDPSVDLVQATSDALLEVEYPSEGRELAARLLKSSVAKKYDEAQSPRVELEVVSRLTPGILHGTARESDGISRLLLAGLDLWPYLGDYPDARSRLAPHLLVAAVKVASWPAPKNWSGHRRGDDGDVGQRLEQHRVRPQDLVGDGFDQAVKLLAEDLRDDPRLAEQMVLMALRTVLRRDESGGAGNFLLAPLPPDLARRHGDMSTVVAAVLRPYWMVKGGRAAQDHLAGLLRRLPEDEHKLVRSWWGEFAPSTGRISIPRRKGSS